MKAEKIIKLQARHNLSKSNWSTIIGCFAVTLIVAFLVLFLYYCLIYGFNTVNVYANKFKDSKLQLVSLFQYSAIILFVLATPVFSGFTKICYNIAKYGKSNTYDLFFYFTRPKLYFRALGINILKGMIFFPCFVLAVAGLVFIEQAVLENDLILLIFGIGVSVADIILFLVLYAKLVFANYILADNSYNNAFFYISESFSLSKGHTISTIKLLLSFTLWFALCFFILPIFYVVPYTKVSMGTSAKWLIKMRKEEFR